MKRINPFRDVYDGKYYESFNRTSFPEFIDVELTNNCNLNCKMCNRQKMTRDRGFMSEHTFSKITDECAARKIPLRFIGWGEPFLHPNIMDFCRSYKEHMFVDVYKDELKLKEGKPLIHITNNGQIITEKQMKEAVEIGIDSIIFSMQGATKKNYEEMRVGADYDKLKENIFKMVEIRGENEKPFISVTSTMINETQEQIDQFIDSWEKVVDYVGVGKTQAVYTEDDESGKMHTYLPCQEVYRKLTIKWDGRVSACCGDFNNTLVVGSLENEKLFNIWRGQQMQAIRTLLNHKNFRALTLCKSCSHAYENFV